MVEEPKAKFGNAEASLRMSHEETGSALMDFFVDPTEIFASERHPALKEVLRVLAKNKTQRGTQIFVKSLQNKLTFPPTMYCLSFKVS